MTSSRTLATGSLHRACAVILTCFLLLNLFGPWSGQAQAATPRFVTRAGSDLVLDGKPFRFAGANIFWLGLESKGGRLLYPSAFRVDNAFATVRAMGGTVVRSHAALSTGCAQCIQPTRGQFNETALRQLDLVIKTAGDYGIRLVLPLTDNHQYYHGGKHNYTTWRGIADENRFFTDPVVIADFKRHVAVLLHRVNTYTGVAYKDDPTILAWETGNELALIKGGSPNPGGATLTGMNDKEGGQATAAREYNGPPPPAWTANIAKFIHGQARQLVMDGTNMRGKATRDDGFPYTPYPLNIAGVDIYSAHYYYHSSRAKSIYLTADLREDSSAVKAAGRAFVAGEYDWTGKSNSLGEHKLTEFIQALETPALSIDGDMFWSLLGHNDAYGYVEHGDGFTLHYPGDTPDMRARAQQLRSHAFRMRGLAVARDLAPPAPVITNISGVVAWRGVAGAASYTVERSGQGANGPWTTICNQCTTDRQSPWRDPSQSTAAVRNVWYRVKAHNVVGVAGAYSPVAGGATVVDDLNDWSKTASRTPNVALSASNAQYFEGDTARASRKTQTAEEIVWRANGLVGFQARTYFWPSEAPAHFLVFTSADGRTWTRVTPSIVGGQGDWLQYTYSLTNLSNVNYVKMRWNTGSSQPWTAQIGQVSLNVGGGG